MPALVPTDHYGRIVWMGCVDSDDRTELMAQPITRLDVTFEGIAGSVHAGATRPSCSRVTAQYAKGTPIRNVRQLSIVSVEELAVIAARLGISEVDPARLGATVVVEGLSDLSHLPPSARMQAPSGATLTVDMQNHPCQLPARSLATVHGAAAKGFRTAAVGLRGVTAWVEREGPLALGDRLRLHLPGQRPWQPGG